jgi:hypothetical protein
MENNSENITLFSDDTFYILKIDEGQISHLDWNNPDYVQTLVSLPIISTHLVTRDNFMSKIYELLNLQPHTHLVTETIWEEPNYTYQIIFIDTLNKLTTLNKNEFASMLNISGEIINGKAIVIKNFVSTTTNEMSLQSMNSSELHRILKARGYTKIVVFEDDMWRETEVYGDIELYAKKFFEDEYYMKKELGFLQHNINIMYTNSEYGTKVGNILDNKVDKCIIYTMVTDSIRGCITKDEVLKIITLSTKLNAPYTCKDEDMKEEFDEHGRRIVKNKYRTLDSYYNKI